MNFRTRPRTYKEKLEYKKDIFKTGNKMLKTQMYLAECKKVGLKLVSIGTATDEIPTSVSWSKHAMFPRGDMAFAIGRSNNWPAIWQPG